MEEYEANGCLWLGVLFGTMLFTRQVCSIQRFKGSDPFDVMSNSVFYMVSGCFVPNASDLMPNDPFFLTPPLL